MKWTLNKVQHRILALFFAGLFFVALAYQWIALIAISIPCFVAMLVINLRYWRCPHCNSWLGRDLPKHCPECGEQLDYDAEISKK